MSKRALLWLSMIMLGGCGSSNGTTDTGGAPGTGGAPAAGGTAATNGSAAGGSFGGSPLPTAGNAGTTSATAGSGGRGSALGTAGGGSGGSALGTAGSGSGGSALGTAGSGSGGAGAAAGSVDAGMAGAAGSGQAGASGTGGSSTGGGVPPQVTPQNATTVPALYGNPVANPGKLTTHVMYPVYYYSTSISSPLPPPTVPKLSSPMMKSCNVYTPPGYDTGTKYPLIVIMHGITDSPDTWNERSNPKIASLFDNLIASKNTKPFIAVFASGTINNNTNGYYSFGGELTNDLLPFIEANYSVSKDRGSRAMAGFSFGGMQTLSIGLCAHLKDFAWFAGLDPAGPGTPSADDIAKYVGMQNPQMYPLYYFYISVGKNDGTAGGSSANAANGLASKGPNITSANFSYQNDIVGSDGGHDYPTAEVGLYNFLRMAFPGN